jgi:glycosyltransferase involved in cell wall biosynthesis
MTTALRVLMVTTEWPRERWGGTATFIQRQAAFLRAAGVNVDVFEFVGARNPANYARAWWAVHRRAASARDDLIHAQFGQSALAALPTRLPLVVTFRGDDLLGALADGDHARITATGRLLARASRWVARHADQVIVVSPHMLPFLGNGTRAHVLPSGLDFDALRLESPEEARGALGLPADRRLVLFIGNPYKARKRFDLAQAAMARVDPALRAELIVAWEMPHAGRPSRTSMSAASPSAFWTFTVPR